ncbi:uncharacterized protein LOC107271740 [Cephus cinctus]|uniref:Uncharacterized protein LOC107271740 n=1 Tax=Cephus cinctus TaxID=211228 RepID=A0AAJ7W528_CEPCN|nr:uncharacterized protein LOC107271740 [Cephus cinctus]XP_015603587.1 uncharacterized protein LOC107271740 [Cephus cinctus]XP_015603596.1 uncharacterized protein LOC107271740 [Cephus cinctus]XP_024944701.1 uncharacterized protein LOC107271740 [Cephus cinctus]XP_024944702.1 uncharacterized protein LOC107271740 [Cephus cinctus]XP_024944703.1 uncharacterized protein LOC107271740 [Cephus cinctus]XP_024944704.1 uncharacterized protein LOC107271740 [Cephus cinctus]XP_024944705.1 uncharacterized p
MTVKCRGSKFWLSVTLTVSLILVDSQHTSTETSAQYLRNVMNELQEINSVSVASADTDRNTGNVAETKYIQNLDQTSSYRDKFHPHVHQVHYQYPCSSDKEEKIPAATDIRGVDQVYLESSPHYFTIPADQTKIPSPIEVPQALGFTRSQLAGMYRDALEKGSAVSLTGLTSSLSPRKVPQASTGQLQLPAGHAGYYYYFYPLKTFMNELRDVHGYKTIRDALPEKVNVAESSEKQMANPLFVAISSFIGMALLFMIGVLFLPRLGGFTSRNVQDEFLQLTKVAAEAVNGRDCYGRITCEMGGATGSTETPLRGYRFPKTVSSTTLGKRMRPRTKIRNDSS